MFFLQMLAIFLFFPKEPVFKQALYNHLPKKRLTAPPMRPTVLPTARVKRRHPLVRVAIILIFKLLILIILIFYCPALFLVV